MPTYLEGIAAQFYRGIGPETQYIAPFSDMNFFVGANNAGKSVVLNLIKDRLPNICDTNRGQGPDSSLEAWEDRYLGVERGEFRVAIGLKPAAVVRPYYIFRGQKIDLRWAEERAMMEKLCGPLERNGCVWMKQAETKSRWAHFDPVDIDKVANTWSITEWQAMKRQGLPEINSLVGHLGQDVIANYHYAVPKLLDSIVALHGEFKTDCLLIPAKRSIGNDEQATGDLSGQALILDLAKLKNPDFRHYEEETGLFAQVDTFLQTVIGKPAARLTIPDHKRYLQVHVDGKTLPLSSFGTGIHEVILIAAFCTIHQEKIMCIEEPEIHLHPVLQRKLIQYLKENTRNQYFIATHSAAFIDTPGASVFHVRNDGVQTYVTCAVKPGDKRKITDELGYRASDILQSNAVIWVEGPSDRIYIKHWLGAVNAELKEGIHYTIMFYGGRLISQLSADEDALDQFIRLRRLNQNMAIVIDSDREHSRALLKPAAQRLKEEMADADGLVWITQGREIENYVEADRLHDALKTLHPRIYGGRSDVGRYDHAFHFKRKSPKAGQTAICTEADKVGVATFVCDGLADLSILDLRKQITALAQMIEKAQGV